MATKRKSGGSAKRPRPAVKKKQPPAKKKAAQVKKQKPAVKRPPAAAAPAPFATAEALAPGLISLDGQPLSKDLERTLVDLGTALGITPDGTLDRLLARELVALVFPASPPEVIEEKLTTWERAAAEWRELLSRGQVEFVP
jgi:hypothetical protein